MARGYAICAVPTAALDGFRHPFKLHSYSDLTELDFKWRAYPPAYWICLRLRCTVGGMWHAAHYFVLGSLCFVWLRGAYSFTAWESLPK